MAKHTNVWSSVFHHRIPSGSSKKSLKQLHFLHQDSTEGPEAEGGMAHGGTHNLNFHVDITLIKVSK